MYQRQKVFADKRYLPTNGICRQTVFADKRYLPTNGICRQTYWQTKCIGTKNIGGQNTSADKMLLVELVRTLKRH
jgi:hypothetical protein